MILEIIILHGIIMCKLDHLKHFTKVKYRLNIGVKKCLSILKRLLAIAGKHGQVESVKQQIHCTLSSVKRTTPQCFYWPINNIHKF